MVRTSHVGDGLGYEADGPAQINRQDSRFRTLMAARINAAAGEIPSSVASEEPITAEPSDADAAAAEEEDKERKQ